MSDLLSKLKKLSEFDEDDTASGAKSMWYKGIYPPDYLEYFTDGAGYQYLKLKLLIECLIVAVEALDRIESYVGDYAQTIAEDTLTEIEKQILGMEENAKS